MTPDEINIAIAKSLRYQVAQDQPDRPIHTLPGFPDFTGSLDACSTFEKRMDSATCAVYNRILREVTDANPVSDVPAENYGWHASPMDRCEAYLLAINKWVNNTALDCFKLDMDKKLKELGPEGLKAAFERAGVEFEFELDTSK